MTHRGEIVELVGSGRRASAHQGRLIHKVGFDQMNVGKLVLDHLAPGVGLTSNKSVDLVALCVQQVGEVTPVLTSDTSDERSTLVHCAHSFSSDTARAIWAR